MRKTVCITLLAALASGDTTLHGLLDETREAARLAEIDAAGELADDEHVDAGQELRTERRGRHERRVDAHRAQVGEEAQAPAQCEEGLLGADRRLRVVPARAADGAEQDRVEAPLPACGRDPLLDDEA